MSNSKEIPSILFVCTANQCRSPIAAATFTRFQEELLGFVKYKVVSAGTWTKTGLEVASPSVRLARKVGVDLRGFRTTSVVDVQLSAFSWILVMEKGHQEALTLEYPELQNEIQLLTTFAGAQPSDIPDPIQYDVDTALGILRDMQDCVHKIALRLLPEISV